MKEEIRQTRWFSRPPQEVWEYLTKPDLLELWLGKSDIKPVEGHKFRFISSYGNDSHCEILEVKPFTRLSYTWQKNSSKNNKPYQSKIVWTLVPKEGGTELQLVHTGFAFSEDFMANSNGWSVCLKMLEDALQKNN